MRHKKVKNLAERIEANRRFIVDDPRAYKGKWREFFGIEGPLYIELGCGKGKFITSHALDNPDACFIGIEGLGAVLIRGLEKAAETEIPNVRYIMEYVVDIRDFFEDDEVDGVYLNFSDPWPKARHAKRRFTFGDTLLKYRQILKDGGFVAFKTDNEELFEFTLEEIERLGLPINEMSRDLHNSDLAAREYTTEYEDKFRGYGKNINYVKIWG
ncbi:MAG: tRNA (guanosine(46)-N7)-methyltransferase TrmB [Eubacterium sp.]|nr:tRNA (guanosine(46)-N7)-methyltransferase TrmB [Candidatus Colimonas fimequi]